MSKKFKFRYTAVVESTVSEDYYPRHSIPLEVEREQAREVMEMLLDNATITVEQVEEE